MDICFATNNENKLTEIRPLLQNHNILSLKDIKCDVELPETSVTLEGNSLQKAQYIWDHYKIPCFADDTGLEVSVLKGAPGVYSARYAGKECNAENNMNLLLRRIGSNVNRTAQFRSVITLILGENDIHTFEGVVTGKITKKKTGGEGFGYDPIFKPDGYEMTFAEMSLEKKNQISHRGKAIKKLADFLNRVS